MIMAFVYTYALENRGQKVKFFMITMPVQYLPWAFALFELVAGGPVALILSLVGIVAAHTHNFLTQIYPTFGRGKNYLATPAFVRSYFSSNVPRTVHRGYGTAVRGESQREPSSGWASSLQGDWSARGRGRRLGGD